MKPAGAAGEALSNVECEADTYACDISSHFRLDTVSRTDVRGRSLAEVMMKD